MIFFIIPVLVPFPVQTVLSIDNIPVPSGSDPWAHLDYHLCNFKYRYRYRISLNVELVYRYQVIKIVNRLASKRLKNLLIRMLCDAGV
jgi:hypothetical protein